MGSRECRVLIVDDSPEDRVVMLAGRGEESDAVLALKRGAQDDLVKGHFTPEVLRQTVDDAIEKVAIRHDATGPAVETRDRLRVLVVDDNAHAAESLSMVLQIWDHETRVAHQGADALELAPRFRPQVVLLDIGLPGQDGYAIAKVLREAPEARDVLLIAMTGHGREEDFRRSREAGFDHHLVKPLDFDELEAILADVEAARKKFQESRG